MQVGGGAKSGQSEGGRGWRNPMIGQMVTEIVSEAKAGHFAGLVPVILPLLDGGSSHRNGTTGDPDKLAHPVVNGAPQRRRSPMGGGPIHVNVDEHGSYRAAWSGNWLGRSLGTNVRYRRASNLAGRNASEA